MGSGNGKQVKGGDHNPSVTKQNSSETKTDNGINNNQPDRPDNESATKQDIERSRENESESNNAYIQTQSNDAPTLSTDRNVDKDESEQNEILNEQLVQTNTKKDSEFKEHLADKDGDGKTLNTLHLQEDKGNREFPTTSKTQSTGTDSSLYKHVAEKKETGDAKEFPNADQPDNVTDKHISEQADNVADKRKPDQPDNIADKPISEQPSARTEENTLTTNDEHIDTHINLKNKSADRQSDDDKITHESTVMDCHNQSPVPQNEKNNEVRQEIETPAETGKITEGVQIDKDAQSSEQKSHSVLNDTDEQVDTLKDNENKLTDHPEKIDKADDTNFKDNTISERDEQDGSSNSVDKSNDHDNNTENEENGTASSSTEEMTDGIKGKPVQDRQEKLHKPPPEHVKGDAKPRQTVPKVKEKTPSAGAKQKDDNIKFYRNVIKSKPVSGGRKIEEMLAWHGDYSQLESGHSYIQWLFPIPDGPGLNSSAQELHEHEAEVIRKEPKLQERVLKAYMMMLNFYGMELACADTGDIRKCQKNWKDRFKHLNKSRHNYLRITRILKSLGELGYDRFQFPLVKFIMTQAVVTKDLSNLDGSSMDYWMDAIKNDEERVEIQAVWTDMKEHPNLYTENGNKKEDANKGHVVDTESGLKRTSDDSKG